ncbi:LytR/AlgR family response regulator transcription factor [Vibrio variabilis]|uniref:LytR/AlgR family response regulator transcription factor n=1 Tax=Vibrio variabilis TaxID=990271 RepID=UPI000DD8FB26|nr:LytTR family DNA-binding domain-containing protein [Vibrio variabilis]
MIKALIADDEPLLRFHLDKLLAEAWPELEVVAKCENGEQALAAMEREHIDVAFLDIQMPGKTGLDVAREIAKRSAKSDQPAPLVIFITAFDHYAVSAFEANAMDYLLKPVDEARLIEACKKAKSRLSSHNPAPELSSLMANLEKLSLNATPQFSKWLKASKQDEIHLVSVDDIAYLKAEDKYVTLVTDDKREYVLRSSIKELSNQLDPDCFWQIHRSTMINLHKLEKVKKDLTGKMNAYVAGSKLPVSRALQHLFK